MHAGSPTSSLIEAALGLERQSGSPDTLPGPLSADIVEQQIASLVALPEYIRKLERRERAAQRSAEIKTRKIAQLEAEVQRCVSVEVLRRGHLFADEGRWISCVLG